MSRSHWRCVLGMVVAVAVMVPAGLAWACVGLISLTTDSSTVQPGGTVTVVGREFAEGAPVHIHLDSPAGRLLATVPPPTSTMTSQFQVDVAIPPDVRPGEHILVATQDYHNMNAGAPARALIHVGTPPAVGPAPPAEPARAATVSVSAAPSVASLVMIGLGVAAAGLLLAGLWYLVAARRHPQPVTEASKA